jgi:hypothetical protein
VLRTRLTDIQIEVVFRASGLEQFASPWGKGVVLATSEGFAWLHE